MVSTKPMNNGSLIAAACRNINCGNVTISAVPKAAAEVVVEESISQIRRILTQTKPRPSTRAQSHDKIRLQL